MGIPVQELGCANPAAYAGQGGLGIDPVTITAAITATKWVINNKDEIKKVFSGLQNKDNTTPFPPGYIAYWKYMPGQPKFGQPVQSEPTNIGYAKHWDSIHKADYQAAGIPDLATLDSLFKQYATEIIRSGSYQNTAPSWTGLFRALKQRFDRDQAIVESTQSGSNTQPQSPVTASTSLWIFLILVLISAGAYVGSKTPPKNKKVEINE